MNTTTDANGLYTFLNVAPGTYQVNVAPGQSIVGATSGTTVTLNPASAATQNLSSAGLGTGVISLRLFLASTTAAEAPVQPLNFTPVVKTPIAAVTVTENAANTDIDLAANFTDPDLSNSMVQFNTSAGPIDLELFDGTVPQTVANFFDYIDSGDYDDSIFHRLAFTTDPTGVPFVLQGGDFQFQASPTPQLVQIPVGPTIQNEFGKSNLQGTIAMAKVGSNPNSATDQFFFNLGNNSSNLDNQNGGFTVFGQIVGSVSQQTLNALAALPRPFTSILPSSDLLYDLPYSGYNGTNFLPSNDATSTVAVPGTTAANYALISNVVVASRDDSLTYSVVANSNPGLVTPTISNEQMTLIYTVGQTGLATITVQATDMYGATSSTTFTVTVS